MMRRFLLIFFLTAAAAWAQTTTQAVVNPEVPLTTVVGDVTQLVGRSLNWGRTQIEMTLQNCPGYKTLEAKAAPDKFGKVAFGVPGNEKLGCISSYYTLVIKESGIKVYERVYYIHGTMWDLNRNTFSYTGVSYSNIITVGGVAKVPILHVDKINKKILGWSETDPIFRYAHIDGYDRKGEGTKFQMSVGEATQPGTLSDYNADGSLAGSSVVSDSVVQGAENLTAPGAVAFVSEPGRLTQDPDGLSWDPVNKRLGIGIRNPRYAVDVVGDVAFSGALIATSVHAPVFSGNLSGNAGSATKLAANPSDCDPNKFTVASDEFGNLTCTAIPNAATTANPENTAHSIVARDADGGFRAGLITANLLGNVTGDVTGNVSGTARNITEALVGDVSGPTSATVVDLVGGKSSTAVAAATTQVEEAASANTVGKLVKRDASGNFAAGDITASRFTGPLTGDVTGSISGATGSFSGAVTAGSFSGPLTGNVTGNIAGNLTGNVTGNVSGSAASFTGDLAGDVTGKQGTTVVALVGGKAAAAVAAAVAKVEAATTASTPDTIVVRDASGNVPGVIVTLSGDVTGNMSSNTVALVGGQTAASVADAAAKRHAQNTDIGTSSNGFQIGGGVRLVNNAGNLDIRNQADNGYADVAVGNLTVHGASTTINSTTVNLADNVILLNSNYEGSAPTANAGINVNRGTLAAASILWDESADKWKVGLAGSETAISLEGHTHTLSGDVTSVGLVTTVAEVGGVTAVNVAAGANLANAAVSANTANAIVRRNGSGGFDSGSIKFTGGLYQNSQILGGSKNLTWAYNLGATATNFTTNSGDSSIGVMMDGNDRFTFFRVPGGTAADAAFLTFRDTYGKVQFDLVNGRVGVNKVSPAVALDVNGTVAATAFSGPLTGNVTGNVSGTAAALAADPAACGGSTWAKDMAANGTLTCTQPQWSDLGGSMTAAMLPAGITPTVIDFPDDATEKLLLHGAAGSTGTYSLGIEPSTLYYKAGTYHRWYVGRNADAGANDTMELTSSGLTVNGSFTGTSLTLTAAQITAAGNASFTGTVAAAPGGNVPVCRKYTVARTALTAAVATQSVVLFNLPANSKLIGVNVKHSTPFTGGTLTGMTVSVGKTGNATLYTEAFNIYQAAADTTFQDTTLFKSGSAAAEDVLAFFTAVGGNVNAASTGSVDVSACWVTLQ